MDFAKPKNIGPRSNVGLPCESTSEVLRSDYHADPQMRPLVEGFVERLPKRLRALENAIREADWKLVASLSHQLKGAAGGYGFPSLTKLQSIELTFI